MSIKRTEYTNDKQITALKSDSTNNAIWVAFAKNSEDNVIIERQSAFEPSQTFFTINRSVNKVNKMTVDTTNLYVAYDDDTLLGEILSLTNPLTNTTEIPIPIGITEKPISLVVKGTDLFFLLPGSATGENAKVLQYNTSGVLQDTIDLSKTGISVVNASDIDIDDNDDLRISTDTDPGTLVRVFELSGGGFDFTVEEIM